MHTTVETGEIKLEKEKKKDSYGNTGGNDGNQLTSRLLRVSMLHPKSSQTRIPEVSLGNAQRKRTDHLKAQKGAGRKKVGVIEVQARSRSDIQPSCYRDGTQR